MENRMPRISIAAAVLAILLLVVPAASARPIDLGYPAYPTPEVTTPKVMPERITDHPADEPQGLAAPFDEDSLSVLVREQESTSGSGNQGVAPPRANDDSPPWAVIGLSIAATALLAGGLVLATRRTRTRSRVAA
jgi:hypothetical protein